MLRHYVSFILLLLVSFNSGAFGSFSLKFSSIETTAVNVRDVALQFSWVDTDHIDLLLDAKYLNTVLPGEFKDAQVDCRGAYFNGEILICQKGKLVAQHPEFGKIQASLNFTYKLQHGLLDLSMQARIGSTSSMTIDIKQAAESQQTLLELKKIEVTLLQALLEQYEVLAEHTLTTGLLDATVNIKSQQDRLTEIDSKLFLSDFGIDGESILEGVTIASQLSAISNENNWMIISDSQFKKGAMYLSPDIIILNNRPGIYLELMDKPISIQANLQWQTETKRLNIDELIYEHSDHLSLRLSSDIAFQQELKIDSLALDIRIPELQKTFPVYISPFLLQTNFSDIETIGAINLTTVFEDNELQKLMLKIDDVFIEDKLSRYGLSGLSADFSLSSQTELLLSELSWQGLSLYRLNLGAGDITFESSEKNINIIDWQDVDILDGKLLINGLSMNNVGTVDFELLVDGGFEDVSMQSFTQAMGWPLFKGDLSSAISGFKYSHNSVQIDGDILIQAFNGDVVLQQPKIDDLFSDFSNLSTNILVNALDLEQLTDTFSFGKIEGTLSGKMLNLKLEDWQPVYFEAEFSTQEDDDKPHRISQKALENLNQIGGGLSGTLSSGFLKFFPTYSYGHIGISCRLYRGVCELGGVENTEEGFYILTRGGLLPPWVEVKGTGRSIVWDHLLDGLKRITEGDVSLE